MNKISKLLSIFLIAAIALFSWYSSGSAERLHHWTDSKGVTHLSREPPPEDGQLIEIMEYPVRTDKPAQTDPADSGQKPAKQNEKVIVEKSQKPGEQPEPKDDPATACYLYANNEDVHVYVIEYAGADRVLEKILYQGTIPEDQQQFIESSRGKIEYNYRRSSEDRSYGDNHADCVNGNVISVP